MWKYTVQKQQPHVQARSAPGTKGERERKTPKDFLVLITLQKESKVTFKWSILIPDQWKYEKNRLSQSYFIKENVE